MSEKPENQSKNCINADQKALYSYGWMMPLVVGIIGLFIGVPALIDIYRADIWDFTKWASWSALLFTILAAIMFVWAFLAIWMANKKKCV